jgi:hypothetical protein
LGGPQAALTWQFYDASVQGWRIRKGLVVTLMAAGNFWTCFTAGAAAGNPVYASLTDGSAISGEVSGAELTPRLVCYNVEPRQFGQISTTAVFNS